MARRRGSRTLTLPWHSVWITGASSGIGAALARRLAAPGVTLYLSGRAEERLAAVAAACRDAGATATPVPFDMADSAARRRAIETVLRSQPPPEMLVNNAGISQRGRALETDVSVDRTIMEVDYLAGVELTKALLPVLVERRHGCIVAVSSVAGLAPVPERSSYNAAKSAQLQFFGTLANELAGSGVQVNLVIPGFVKTAVSINALTGTGTAHGTMDPNQTGGLEPDLAAARILRGIRRNRRRIYVGFPPKLLFLRAFAKLVPGVLDRILEKAEVR